jgi:hypothetical protein
MLRVIAPIQPELSEAMLPGTPERGLDICSKSKLPNRDSEGLV